MQHLFTNAAKLNDGSKPVKMQMSKKIKIMKIQKDILFESIENIENDILLEIGKRWELTDISLIKNRLYSAVYFGDIDYVKILIKYNLL